MQSVNNFGQSDQSCQYRLHHIERSQWSVRLSPTSSRRDSFNDFHLGFNTLGTQIVNQQYQTGAEQRRLLQPVLPQFTADVRQR